MTSRQIAHDVRRPLASMKALLTVLPEIKDDPTMLQRFTVDVDRKISQTNSMLSEILDYSCDSVQIVREESDIQRLITSALTDVFVVHDEADIEIEYDFGHRRSLSVDGDRIIRLLSNIIGNAVESMRPHSMECTADLLTSPERARRTLFFKTRDVGNMMQVTVGNTGSFIPDEERQAIFEPFFTRGKKGGTGLGLTICRKIVDLHGGTIQASSHRGQSCEEDVTEFTIELPSSEGRFAVNESELVCHSDDLKKFKVMKALQVECHEGDHMREFMRLYHERNRPSYLLIVDDEPLLRETVRSLLRSILPSVDHVKVVECGFAEEALTVLSEREFDYLIADIDLGRTRMNGYEFTQAVLDQYPNIHVLIHSNKRREEMDKNIRQRDNPRFMGFLPKPMKRSELLQFLACRRFEAQVPDSSCMPPRKKILVVNDDDGLLLSFRIMLKSPGVQMLEASSVSDALKWISVGGVDVILSDINLGEGEKDGYELLRTVREKDADVPFYLVSGYSRADEEPKAKKGGASGYLELPVGRCPGVS